MDTYERALRKIMEDREKYQYYMNNRVVIGPTGPTGEKGDIGPTGPKGEDGTSVTILGNFNTFDDLINKHPTGLPGQSYLVDTDLYIWSNEDNGWINVGQIMGPTGNMGPTGPKGQDGTSVTILGSFNNLEELKQAHPTGTTGQSYLVGVDLYVWASETNNWINVGRIMGPQGIQGPTGDIGPIGPTGPTGEKGDIGIQGPTGPKGEDGTSVTILGSFNSLDELKQNHPNGSPGQSYLVNADLYVWSNETNSWINVGRIMGPKGDQGVPGPKGDQGPIGPRGIQGPQGEIGPTGPTGLQGIQGIAGPKGDQGPQGIQGIPGPLEIPTLYTVTSNEGIPSDGFKVDPDERIPLEIEVLDNTNNFYVSSQNNTITFLRQGIYRIDFVIQARTSTQVSAQDGSNIISIGFRRLDESTVYAGNSVWGSQTTPTTIVGHGIVNLTYPKQLFELVNLGKFPIFLQSPKIESLGTESSFASPIVTIMIQAIT